MKVPTTLPEIPELITSKRDEIAALCREYGVARLEVFGSVMTDEFDPDRSDVDFIVRFTATRGLSDWLDRRHGLQLGLTSLLGRDADLVESETGVFKDPYFRRWADPTRRLVFDALQGGQAPQRHPTANSVPA